MTIKHMLRLFAGMVLTWVEQVILPLISDYQCRIGRLKIYFCVFSGRREWMPAEEKTLSASLHILEKRGIESINNIKCLIFYDSIEHMRESTISYFGIYTLIIRYKSGLTDNEDLLAAILIDYSTRASVFLGGANSKECKKRGLSKAIEYLAAVDSSGKLTATYEDVRSLLR